MEEKWKKNGRSTRKLGKHEKWEKWEKWKKNGRKMEQKWRKTVFRHRFGGNGKMGERMS